MEEIYAYAQQWSTKRLGCGFQTEYSHDNLVAYLSKTFGDEWKIYAPQSCEKAPSSFPRKNNKTSQKALCKFIDRDDFTMKDADYMLDGHCETVAAALSEYGIFSCAINMLEQCSNRSPKLFVAGM
eukprot:m.200614 g.200614  ORF g.200614 m.200614 type:complete len:126 (-) comp15738_c0_seq13:1792-2169(-)